jgi:acetoacetyl-CoA synthetase
MPVGFWGDDDGSRYHDAYFSMYPGVWRHGDWIERRIRDDCSPRHVPNEIHAVPEIPRTLSAKLLEVPVKRILLGADPAAVASRDSLANPGALDWFVEWAGQRPAA